MIRRSARAKRLWLAAGTALVLAASSVAGATPDAFQATLERADAARSSDPATFNRLLDELARQRDEATPAQREYLHLLEAYRTAYTGRFDEAIASAREIFETSDDAEVRYRAGSMVANGLAATRDFATGLSILRQTLALDPQIADPELVDHVHSVAGIVYNQMGQYRLGLEYANGVLARTAVPRTRCYAKHLRLEAMVALDELVDADDAILDDIAFCENEGESLGANLIRLHLARRWRAQGRIQDAIRLLEENLPAIESTAYPPLVGESKALLAELLQAEGSIDEAAKHAEAAIAVSSRIASALPTVIAHRVLYEIALRRGDRLAALDHHIKFAEADRAYLDEVRAREIAFQLAQHETQRNEQTIALLNKQNEVLQLEQRVARQDARNTQLLVALLLALLGFIGYWAWKTKKTQVSFRRLAEIDALTGISNRHHFSRRAEEELARCRQAGESATLVMFDLDEFKSINDRYGHPVGDWVLAQVASALGETGRHGDLFGRIGGEEFAFLLPAAAAPAGIRHAELCRARLATIDTTATGHDFRITASFGVVDSESAGPDFNQLLACGDEAMYRAKHAGRDRVEAFAEAT